MHKLYKTTLLNYGGWLSYAAGSPSWLSVQWEEFLRLLCPLGVLHLDKKREHWKG